jgi:hypothetical protein
MFRSALALTLFATLAFAQRQPPGQALFEKNCSSCHSESAGAPPQAALSMLSTESIFDTLMKGRMKDVVSKMTSRERRTVAEFLGKQPLHFVVRLGRPTNARFQTAGAAALRGRCPQTQAQVVVRAPRRVQSLFATSRRVRPHIRRRR